MSKYKIRIQKCYYVDIIDENGYTATFANRGSLEELADAYCYGTKEEAKQLGKELLDLVKRYEEEAENDD